MGCLDWDSFATFLRLFSDADAQVRKRRDSFASTQVIELCWVRRVDWATQTRLSEAWTWTVPLWILTTERGCSMAGSSYRKILFSYCWKSWKNGDSYRACVLLIVYGHYLCISLYFWLIDRAAYWFALSIFYKLYHLQVDFTQTKFNFTLAKFNSTQTKYNFTQNDIQFHSSDIQFHTNEIQCHTNKIQFHANEIQFHQNENSISNIHEIAKLPNSEQLFCYKLHPKILIIFIILVYFNQQ